MLKATLTGLWFLLLFSFHFTNGQTFHTIQSCDTIITNPNPGFPAFSGTHVVTVTGTPGSHLGFNVENFNYNYGGNVSIYNGPTTGSPLITTLTDFFAPGVQLHGGQTIGNSITISFAASGNSIQHFKIRVRCVPPVSNFPVWQPLKNMIGSGNIKILDYDNDGDKDALIGGRVYRNDSYFDSTFVFERKENPISGWSRQNITCADFNNDGLKDIFITGYTSVISGGLAGAAAAIYKNNGNNTFTRITTQAFSGAMLGACAVVDFNHDGKPDISYTGSTIINQNTTRIFKIYINNGNFSFSDANVLLPGLSGLIAASISWADSDNDGDPDLVINGYDGFTNVTRFYTTNGNILTNIPLPFTATSDGAMHWADFNNDGKMDIINIGVSPGNSTAAITPEIFINNGANAFTKIITNLPKLFFGSSDIGDYNSDQLPDIVLTGFFGNPGAGYRAITARNTGNGQFIVKDISGGESNSGVKWVDFNNDGKLDIAGIRGLYAKNMGADSFKISSFDAPYISFGYGHTLAEDFDNDGLIDVLLCGDVEDVDCSNGSTSSFVAGRGWRNYGKPKFTVVADVTGNNPVSTSGFPAYFYYQWGDFNSDGKSDIIMTSDNSSGSSIRSLVVYRNNGNNNFSLFFNSAVTPLPAPPFQFTPYSRFAGLFDIDNDGINELFVFPGIIYKNFNNNWSIHQVLSDCPGDLYADFADYNGDGFVDIAVSSETTTAVYKNDGSGHVVNISVPQSGNSVGFLGRGSFRQIKWSDINNDGKKDLITSEGVYENINGNLVYVRSGYSKFVHTGTGDFNGDGFTDLITVPEDLSNGNIPLEILYNEGGSFFFDKEDLGTIARVNSQAWNESSEAFDIDNDGDDDIIYSGFGSCNGGPAVIVNEGRFDERKLHVVSPNGGENVVIGTTKPISWYGNLISNSVKIEISRDNGVIWQTIIAAAPSTSEGGHYDWQVTGPASSKCRVKISDNIISLSDRSDTLFTVSGNSIPVSAHAGNDTVICVGGSAHLGVAAVPGISYSWTSVPTGLVSSISNPIVSPFINTIYYLVATDGISIARDTVSVIVAQPGTPTTVSITASQNNICLGNNVTFSSVLQNSGINNYYQWKINGNNAGNNSSIFSTSVLQNGDGISLVVSGQNSCGIAVISVSNILSINATVLNEPLVTVADRLFTIANPEQGVAYNWQQSIAGQWYDIQPFSTGVTFTAPAEGTYRVKAVRGICVKYSGASSVTRAGVSDSTLVFIYLHPNPAEHLLNISRIIPGQHWNTAEIITLQGQRILPALDIRGLSSATIDISTLLAGIYFVRITKENGTVRTYRFIKK